MKPVIIIAIAFVLLIPASVFAQSSSQSENCPAGTKAEVRGANIECVQISNVKRTCPVGTYQGLDNQGNFACRDIDTNQIVDPNTGIMTDSQTGEIILGEGQMGGIVLGVIFLIIIIAIAVKVASSKSKSDSYKDVERADFTSITKDRVMELQHGQCAMCGKFPRHWEFDHIDSRGDNSIENCQGLCRDCHQDKTLKDNERHRDSEDE
ncbi:MAG: HNH endonuclease [Thaumarchaeota archaeon]|nr:HNH endonuclease [Nitrososphaerota archaeon]